MPRNLRESYFMEIPVYRCPPSQYQHEIELQREESVNQATGYGMTRENAEAWFNKYENPGSWRFNQIIGYLRLFVDFGRDVIKAEYWRIQQKRILRIQGKKQFSWRPGNAIEVWFSRDEPSSEIYNRLLENLVSTEMGQDHYRRKSDLETAT